MAAFEYKLVVVVREDLPLGCGKWCAQTGHAAVECALKARTENSRWFHAWYAEGQRKVVLRAPGEADLLELKSKADAAKLPTALVKDAGLTQVPPGTLTCLGIGPAPEHLIDAVTGGLKLMR